ncbi:MAG: efflux RND transporter periplasmic adaptor subunit [Pseudomonadota bacterium]|jgi:multidrug efflux pump subunit AcrA (membrane-fusion protein)
MKNPTPLHRAALLALGLTLAPLAGCGKSEQPQASASRSSQQAEDKHDSAGERGAGPLKLGPEEIAAAGIRTDELKEEEVSERLTVTATIRPNQDRIAHVAPRVPGRIVKVHAILGELAQPDKPLFTVADLSRLWIEANLFEKDLSRIQVGADAVVTVAAYPDAAFQGKLTHIGAVVDKETRTVPARVEVANPDGRLKPEMFATAAIPTGGKGKGLLLSEEAVVLMQGQPTVFVEEHGGFEPRAVELGDRLRGRVVVKAGLQAGERVVTAGTYALKARILKSQLGAGHGH